MLRNWFPLGILSLCASVSIAQLPQSATQEVIPAQAALDRVNTNNVLTFEGKPFHAVLAIAPQKSADSAYKAQVELFWAADNQYKLIVDSPAFHQTLTVNGSLINEVDRGDFYPNWLRGFVTALINPMPRQNDLRTVQSGVAIGPNSSYSCLRRDDRPGGITDQKTWAQICFSGEEPRLQFAIDFEYNMEFSDFRRFQHKQIGRTYITGTADHERLVGTLTTLDPWTPDPALLAVATPTPPAERIATTFVSTATEESMVESTPHDVVWPAVSEGKLDGFMIVHATTDRTGQVREASKHNSDNPHLESYGREVALKYKFKPLIIDGIPQQMEMPLVLHFTTKLGDPIPEFDDATSRKMISGCNLPHEIADPPSAGQQIIIQFQVSEEGAIMNFRPSDRNIPFLSLYQQFHGCHFQTYSRNGQPTAYHANVTMTAK